MCTSRENHLSTADGSFAISCFLIVTCEDVRVGEESELSSPVSATREDSGSESENLILECGGSSAIGLLRVSTSSAQRQINHPVNFFVFGSG